jgi:ABC-type multidrug transport system fused ATPase/permease subunit
MFVLVIFVANLALPKFGVFQEVAFQFAERRAKVLEFGQLFDDEGKYIIPDGKQAFTGITGPIEFRNLSFSYPDSPPVLHDVSFTIEKGQMTALVGPSGAGKTTLVHLLARLYDVPPNTLLIDGTDIRSFSQKSLHRSIALMSQDPYIFNDTLRNNVVFGIEELVTDEKLEQVLTQARLKRFVQGLPLGLETRIGDRGINLSGGQRQRVAIARALLKEASLVILDEATSSLDSKSERLIQSAIEDAVKNRTAVVIAHRLSTVKRADKLIVLNEGRVVEGGTLSQLLENKGLFYELWQEQKF